MLIRWSVISLSDLHLRSTHSFLTIEDVHHGHEKLATRKAGDLQGVKAEMLKWTREKMHYWKSLKGKRVESFGDLNLEDMYKHCKNLYEQSNVDKMECDISLRSTPSFFTIQDVHHGLKKLATRKAGDLQGVKA